MQKLKVLYADWNSLTHIDLSNNRKLESLNLSRCKLRSLNLSNNKKITDFDISYNKNYQGLILKIVLTLSHWIYQEINLPDWIFQRI